MDPLIKSHWIILIHQAHFDISSLCSGIGREKEMENVETEIGRCRAAVRRQRERFGAASTTVEALMYELRTFGLAAQAGSNCQRRLAELNREQLHEIIRRLMHLRSHYPAITDELLYQSGEQLGEILTMRSWPSSSALKRSDMRRKLEV